MLYLLGISIAQQLSYDNYTVYRLIPKHNEAMKILQDWQNNRFTEFNFWTEIKGIGQAVDVMIPPHLKSLMKDVFVKNFDASVMIENVQDRINRENVRKVEAGTFDWTSYHTLDEVSRVCN